MEIGIIGLPNVGKSTVFNALTGGHAAAENFPFTTIEPNLGVVPLEDSRLQIIAEKTGSPKATAANIRFIDIAGLVKNAHQGEGLGNKFLSDIRSVDAIAHVLRFFKHEDVVDMLSGQDPLKAIDIIETELLLADLQQAERALEKVVKPAKTGDKVAQAKLKILQSLTEKFNQGVAGRLQNIPGEVIAEYQFLTAKPVFYVVNKDEQPLHRNVFAALQKRAENENTQVVTVCARLEAEIMELPFNERAAYYESAGIKTSGLSALAEAGKKTLSLISFFTANENEARAWLIQKGSTAVKAAGKIHTDMEKGFIRAEVYKYKDLVALGSFAAIREKGLMKSEGKDYVVEEGDIIYFRFHP